jgi:tetratricopeptide (TPR) repeat protein
LTVQLARTIGDAGAQTLDSPLDLFSLSRIFSTAGSREQSVSICQRALATGLPQPVESQALRHLAYQFKRQRQHELAVEAWLELSRRETPLSLDAFEELAIHYEHRRRDLTTAREFTLAALERLREESLPRPRMTRFTRRLERLQRKLARD